MSLTATAHQRDRAMPVMHGQVVILMEEFRVFADLDACNDSLEISASVNIQHGVHYGVSGVSEGLVCLVSTPTSTHAKGN